MTFALNAGISFKSHSKGLQVTALQEGTSAAESELQPGDIITIADDFILVGMILSDAASKFVGSRSVEKNSPLAGAILL